MLQMFQCEVWPPSMPRHSVNRQKKKKKKKKETYKVGFFHLVYTFIV